MKRATFFKSATPSSPAQATVKPSRQSIRGRISAPIPFPDPLETPASSEIAAATPAPVPVQEVTVPDPDSALPTPPPPPTRASPPPPPVVSAFSEDLENSEVEMSADEAADEDADEGADEDEGAGAGAEATSDAEEGEAKEEGHVEGEGKEVAEAGEGGASITELEGATGSEPTEDDVDQGDGEAADSAEPMPSLQSPKVRPAAAYTIGHRRIPTADLSSRPQQLQQPQLPLPDPTAPPPSSQSQPRLQYNLPQDQPSSFKQPAQSSGSSPPPLSAGPSAVSSTRASGTVSAANSASSPAFRHRTNPSSTLRYSGASGMSSGGAGTSAGNTVSGSPKRKKSTLRGAFSKLFSRRKKTDSQILPTIAADPDNNTHDMDDSQQGFQYRQQQQQQQQQQQRQQQQQQQPALQHRSVRSDPTVLGRPRDSEPKRSASLLITEYDRALRSHSIGPDEILAMDSARNSLQVDCGPDENAGMEDSSGGRRRDTTSAHRPFFSQQSKAGRRRFNNKSETYANILSGSGWTGLSPRPASAQGRKSQKRLSGSDIVSGSASSALGRNWVTGGAGGSGSGGLGLCTGTGFSLFGAAGVAGRNGGGAAADPNEIGRAITSNGRDSLDANNDVSSRRRSRSLSNLHALSFDQGQARGRNDEIRYWRESYDPAFLSPLSSTHDTGNDRDEDDDEDRPSAGTGYQGDVRGVRDKQHGTDGAAFHGGDDDLTGNLSLLQSLPDSPIDSPSEQDGERQKGTKQPATASPQPFSFGNLSSIGTGPMKITQANSMDSRIGGLETRMHRMERVVDQLCHTVPGYKGRETSDASAEQVPRSVPPFPDDFSGPPAIPPIPAIYQAQAATPFASSSRYSSSRRSEHSVDSFDSDLQQSHMSFGDGQTYIGSLHPPSSSATQAQSIMAPVGGAGAPLAPTGGSHSPALRPTSTSTVRGATSLPQLNAANDGSTAELMAQLESERAVRQTLETQVKKLNERVNALSTTMYAMLRDPAAAKPRASREALAAAPSSSSLRGQSAAASAAAAAAQLKAESVLQTAKALGHGVSSLSADEETESEGGFQTPLDGHYNYNNYGDDNAHDTATGKADEATRKKKAARTLSLGQLTLGKSAVQA
ncbi:hypothetical protein SPBR_03413 [Sporothrix brasiliensis 5110]|uniref:Uncharacterized protein n=1 Tax=Sporothrix brasiliensis 5110 TaxID=1398154 RepID=A0A0C2J148_9PEZI|nr:uncharacterized protein SPBR_03413 [Sporothrix brasiliensis 5110]KIH95076.1 hypothetical protein SPBR_03413 [Sporothrix brasiliensis 5110]